MSNVKLPGGPRGPEGKGPAVGGGPDCCCVCRGWRMIGPRSTCDDDPNTGIVLGSGCWCRRGGWTAIPVDVITSTFTPCMSTTIKMTWCHPFNYALCEVLKKTDLLPAVLTQVPMTAVSQMNSRSSEANSCSRTFLVCLFIRFACIRRFIAIRYNIKLSMYVQEPLVIDRSCVQKQI